MKVIYKTIRVPSESLTFEEKSNDNPTGYASSFDTKSIGTSARLPSDKSHHAQLYDEHNFQVDNYGVNY